MVWEWSKTVKNIVVKVIWGVSEMNFYLELIQFAVINMIQKICL